ncbi:hypothetical protein GCM10022223_52380 [Kineosporia mesophila]|uniref:MFS transporter n=2 Tax=Kineosporia mesophila TaxID=566012 RepID=A0ABP7AAU2_9ACTN
MVIVVAPLLAPLVACLGTQVSILLGLLVCAGAYALFMRATPGMPYAEFLLPTLVLFGMGFSLCFASVNAQATTGVSDQEQGLASGLVNTSLQVGTLVVLAVATAVLTGAGSAAEGQALPGMRNAMGVVVGLLLAASSMGPAFIFVNRSRDITTPNAPSSHRITEDL